MTSAVTLIATDPPTCAPLFEIIHAFSCVRTTDNIVLRWHKKVVISATGRSTQVSPPQMQVFLAPLLAFFLSLLGRRASSGAPYCRCSYGDPCWPSDNAFLKLTSQLSQPLIYPRPLAHPCYVPANSSACATTLANWQNGTWRSSHPGQAQEQNFETFTHADGHIDACYMETSLGLPCKQGNVPVVGVAAQTVLDIQHAVKFANEHNLRLVVKNTG